MSDPARPVSDPHATEAGAHDYRALPERQDVVAYETPPLEDDLRVVGPITAEIHVSTARAKDVDIWVKLFDVAPDGTAFNLMSPGLDVVRASARGGGPRRDLLRPGVVYPIRFESLMTGNTFRKGHRLRLVVCGTFFPHFSRNLQTGASEIVSAASRPDRITVHHSPRHPSRLVLPVVASLTAHEPRGLFVAGAAGAGLLWLLAPSQVVDRPPLLPEVVVRAAGRARPCLWSRTRR